MLWGSTDSASGSSKPLYANTTNNTASSTTHGSSANNIGVYGAVMGISATEAQRNNLINTAHKVVHSGWVSQKIGTGPITSIVVNNPGSGINANGYLTITDSVTGDARGANARYVYSSSNTANAQLNIMSTITIVDGGSGFTNVASITVTGPTGIVTPTYVVTLGGRAGRVQYETLVATGSISGDDPRDNVAFGGV